MYKFCLNQKGAVSIFLCIVLLPMIMLSSIFIDMSRINLARSVGAAAGDLALNTALTRYDATLKNMYGLFATSQDIDDLLDNLEDYYRQSIIAAGVPAAEADDYVGRVMQLITDADTSSADLLNAEIVDGTFEVIKPENAHLGNPAVLKSQIVEFMKYRAPLNLGLELLSAFDALKNMDKQSDCIDNKSDFYEQKKTVYETLESVWNKIQEYQYKDAATGGATNGFPKGTYIADRKAELEDLATRFSDLVEKTVKYLYYVTADLSNFKESKVDFKLGTNGMHQYRVFSDAYTSFRSIYYDGEASVDEVEACLTAYWADMRDFNTKYAEVTARDSGNTADSSKKIYLVTKFNDDRACINAAVKLFKSLITLQDACDALERYEARMVAESVPPPPPPTPSPTVSPAPTPTPTPPPPPPYVPESDSAYVTVSSDNVTLTYSDGPVAGGVLLLDFCERQMIHLVMGAPYDQSQYFDMMRLYAARIDGYRNDLFSSVQTMANDVKTVMTDIRTKTKAFRAKIVEKSQNLNDAITRLNSVLTQINNPNSDYNKALTEWKNSANGIGSTAMGEADLREIEKLSQELTADKVQRLITRLTNTKTTMDNIVTEIDKYKYNTTSWSSFPENPTHVTLKGMFPQTQRNTIEAFAPNITDAGYSDVITQLKALVQKGNIATTWNQDSHPDLSSNDTPQLYVYLYNNYYNANRNYGSTEPTNQTSAAGDNLEESQAAYTNAANEQMAQTNATDETAAYTHPYANRTDELNHYKESGNLPSFELADLLRTAAATSKGTTNTDPDSALSGAAEFLKKVCEIVGNVLTDGRDKLYVNNYIMNMFTYDTFEKELIREFASNTSDADQKVRNKMYAYAGGDNDTVTASAGYENIAANALSLTNNALTPATNYMYGGEVEYIIYGNLGNYQANKVAAYGSIFVVRLGLNIVYAFTDAEINTLTTSLATALFGVPPLTPLIPLAKIAFTIGLAIAESSYDVYELSQGKAMPLIKNSKNWMMKPSNVASKVVTQVAKEVANTAIDYGSGQLDKLINMTDEELQSQIDSLTAEGSDLAKNFADNALNRCYNYASEAIDAFVGFCTDTVNEMLENGAQIEANTSQERFRVLVQTRKDEILAAAKEKLRSWITLKNATADAAAQKVFDMAFDTLQSRAGDLLDAMAASASDAVNGAYDTIRRIRDDIQSQINSAIDDLASAANNAISDLKNQAINAIKDAKDEGVQAVRDAVSDQIDQAFGGDSYSAGGVVGSMLEWSYSDYMTLFLLIAQYVDEEHVMVRLADVIELNMHLSNGEQGYVKTQSITTTTKSRGILFWKKTTTTTTTTDEYNANTDVFKLNKSYTFLHIKTTLEVKPMFMKLPLMDDGASSILSGDSWYRLEMNSILGY